MQIYRNIGGNSNIRAFSIGEDYIEVQFNGGLLYRYSYEVTGIDRVEQMKRLAKDGCGLNSYINRYVRKDYEWKR